MFKKDKLDRLIEKHDVTHKANYDVLDCVKGKIQTEEFDGNGVVSINRVIVKHYPYNFVSILQA